MTLARRHSRLRGGVQLLQGDLHNHTMLSDGAGDPQTAFARMRAAGLDVAALTDHASIPLAHVGRLDLRDYPDIEALRLARMPPHSIDAAGWDLTGRLADEADSPGSFTAIRGFEWTEPYVGHANVWFSGTPRDVHTPGRVQGLHTWLLDEEPHALFGYNHPGREPGRFGDFRFEPRLEGRLVGLEMFNRTADFLYAGGRSALVDCLAAGWRPGLIGVSDEHGRSYGLDGKGRTGIWAGEHSRAGVREALERRSTYATREADLLLDASLGGVPAGGEVTATADLELVVDLESDRHARRVLLVQLLAAGGRGLVVHAELAATVGDLTTARVPGPYPPWLVLRLVDAGPGSTAVDLGTGDGSGDGRRSLAYASAWWLD